MEIFGMLSTLIDDYMQPILEGIHFPIGTNSVDSLPFDSLLTDTMLEEFSYILNDRPKIRRFVIENQQTKFAKLELIGPMRKAVQKRNLRLINQLRTLKIIR